MHILQGLRPELLLICLGYLEGFELVHLRQRLRIPVHDPLDNGVLRTIALEVSSCIARALAEVFGAEDAGIVMDALRVPGVRLVGSFLLNCLDPSIRCADIDFQFDPLWMAHRSAPLERVTNSKILPSENVMLRKMVVSEAAIAQLEEVCSRDDLTIALWIDGRNYEDPHTLEHARRWNEDPNFGHLRALHDKSHVMPYFELQEALYAAHNSLTATQMRTRVRRLWAMFDRRYGAASVSRETYVGASITVTYRPAVLVARMAEGFVVDRDNLDAVSTPPYSVDCVGTPIGASLSGFDCNRNSFGACGLYMERPRALIDKTMSIDSHSMTSSAAHLLTTYYRWAKYVVKGYDTLVSGQSELMLHVDCTEGPSAHAHYLVDNGFAIQARDPTHILISIHRFRIKNADDVRTTVQ